MKQNNICYRFCNFEIDAKRRLLSHKGHSIECSEKSIELLIKLFEADNHTVDKNTLLEEIWDGLVVSDWSLSRLVSDTRQLLHQYEPEQEVIQTLRGKGFKLHASVSVNIQNIDDTDLATSTQNHATEQAHEPANNSIVASTQRKSMLSKRSIAVLTVLIVSISIYGAYQMDVFKGSFLKNQQIEESTQDFIQDKHKRLTVLPVEILTNDDQDEWVKYGIMSAAIKHFQGYADIDVVSIDTTLKTLNSIQYQRNSKQLFSQICASLGCTELLLLELALNEDNQPTLSYTLVNKFETTQKTNFVGNNILDSAGLLLEHALQELIPKTPERRLINHTYSNNPSANMDYAIGVHKLYHGELDSALEYISLALKREPSFTWANIYLADVLSRKGQYEEASTLIDKLKVDNLDISQEVQLALIESNMAYDAGNLEKSADISIQALSKIQEFEDMELLGSTHMNIGTSLQALGNLDDAISHLNKAVNLFKEFGLKLREAQATFNLANTLWLKTLDPEQVLPKYEEAGRIFRRVGANYYLAFTKQMSGGVKITSKRYDMARRDLLEAAELFESMGNTQSLLWVDLDLATIALSQGKYDETEKIVLSTYERAGDINYIKAHASGLLAVTYLNTKQLEKAKHYINEREIYEWFDPRPVFSMLNASYAHASGDFAQAVFLAEQLKEQLGNDWQPGHQSFLDAFRSDLAENTQTLFDYGGEFPE